MADSLRVTNFPSSGTSYQVAYDLMQKIAFAESGFGGKEPREYYLTLYGQCFKVVSREQSYESVAKGSTP